VDPIWTASQFIFIYTLPKKTKINQHLVTPQNRTYDLVSPFNFWFKEAQVVSVEISKLSETVGRTIIEFDKGAGVYWQKGVYVFKMEATFPDGHAENLTESFELIDPNCPKVTRDNTINILTRVEEGKTVSLYEDDFIKEMRLYIPNEISTDSIQNFVSVFERIPDASGQNCTQRPVSIEDIQDICGVLGITTVTFDRGIILQLVIKPKRPCLYRARLNSTEKISPSKALPVLSILINPSTERVMNDNLIQFRNIPSDEYLNNSLYAGDSLSLSYTSPACTEIRTGWCYWKNAKDHEQGNGWYL
jgi:hypothetical protein